MFCPNDAHTCDDGRLVKLVVETPQFQEHIVLYGLHAYVDYVRACTPPHEKQSEYF